MKFTVSILTYTALPFAKRCLTAVLARSTDYELILTANGNPEAAAYFQSVKEKNPAVPITVVVNAENEGFIEPNKHALTLAQGDYFVLLNDDATPPPGWLNTLAAPLDGDPKGALSGPEGGCCHLLDNFHGTMGSFEYLEGSCLMCRTEFVRRHGLFAPEMVGAYCEDSDLSLRMREQGYNIHRVKMPLQHARCATSAMVPQVKAWQENNHKYCLARWGHYLKVRKFEFPIIVRRADAWGDVLLTTPIIRALKEQRPLSPIWVQTNCTDIFRDNPHVARCERRVPTTPDAMVINLDMAYENRENVGIVDAYAKTACIDSFERRTEIFTSEKDDAYAAERVPPNGVVVHMGPVCWAAKEWGVQNFALLCRAIQGAGYTVIAVGTSRHTPFRGDIDLREQTTIHQLAAVIRRAKLFVGLDSLPLHLAGAVGTPAVGLFGVTDPRFILCAEKSVGVCATTPSFGLRHRKPGTKVVDDRGVAMASITVPMVMTAVEEQLSRSLRLDKANPCAGAGETTGEPPIEDFAFT